MTSKKQATIKDVADLCGLSKGTIDRVLHNRGEVAESSRDKVLQAIKELNYTPNQYASLLSLKKRYLIIVIIPTYQHGDYWEQVHNGVRAAQESQSSQMTNINVIFFNQFDNDTFTTACNNALKLKPDGLLIAPIFKTQATALVDALREINVPSVLIDSNLNDTEYLAYYGIPQFESGYVAAHQLLSDCHNQQCEIVNFALDRGTAPDNESTHNRYRGIIAYANDNNIDCKIHDCRIKPNDIIGNIKTFDKFFEEHPNVNKLITLNSRASVISDWLELRDIRSMVFVGFDALEKNVEGVKRGYISTLISERIDIYITKAIKELVHYLNFGHKPSKQNNYSSIDILNKYNIDFY